MAAPQRRGSTCRVAPLSPSQLHPPSLPSLLSLPSLPRLLRPIPRPLSRPLSHPLSRSLASPLNPRRPAGNSARLAGSRDPSSRLPVGWPCEEPPPPLCAREHARQSTGRVWWRAGVIRVSACGFERGGAVARWCGGMVAWWRGGVVAWLRGFSALISSRPIPSHPVQSHRNLIPFHPVPSHPMPQATLRRETT